nr:heparan-alpha-glucosaminide N-acetyltransferase [Caloramator proteoclasticus]
MDLFRFIAILLMVIFHIVYDLNEFMGIDINYEVGFWCYIGKVSGLLFIIVAGISSNLGKSPIKKALKLYIFASIITIISFIFFKEEYIRFGILHFLATMTLLSVVLNKLNTYWLILIQLISYFLYRITQSIKITNPFLIPFGFTYYGFVSVDYYPIFPYIIYYILGIFIFRLVYKRGNRILPFEVKSKCIEFISRRSLEIYLLHQPLILAILYSIKLLQKLTFLA